MSKLNDFLTEVKVFYLATIKGNKPKVRPLGFHRFIDGKIIFAVGDFKEVYQQLKENPLVEISAAKPNNTWLRYSGKAVFETDPKYSELAFKLMPQYKEDYEKKGAKFAIFHLEEAIAEIRGNEGEVLETLEC